jgi:chromosome partitioning protein
MILTVGNTKGGTGKSTLAFNIAVARALAARDVLLVDTDEQRSASLFTSARAETLGAPGYTTVSLRGKDVRTQVRQLAPKYQDVIIDSGGRDSDSLRYSLMVSDTLLVPVRPRSVDLWALEQLTAVLSDVEPLAPNLRRRLMVLNAADSQGRDNEEAAEFVREIAGLTLLDGTIGHRKVFANAAAFGRSVLEYAPRDNKAVDELQALVAAIYGIAKA